MKILIVEDHDISLKLLQKIILLLGHVPETVTNGEKAIEACLECHYNLIFMDLYLPELDGIEATKIILRNYNYAGKKKPMVVAVTAGIFPSYRELCLEAGIYSVIEKPYTKNQITEIMMHAELCWL